LKSPGLGGACLDDLDRGFAMIREHPDAATEVAPGVRRPVLARFPLSIIERTAEAGAIPMLLTAVHA
jgi:hypothetical protein